RVRCFAGVARVRAGRGALRAARRRTRDQQRAHRRSHCTERHRRSCGSTHGRVDPRPARPSPAALIATRPPAAPVPDPAARILRANRRLADGRAYFPHADREPPPETWKSEERTTLQMIVTAFDLLPKSFA